MPTYEYQCEACGHKFDRFQSIKAEPIKKCPECGKNKVKRLISIGAGMIFKGSGFYITDYRDKSYTEQAKAESGGGGSKDGESKSDAAKPAAEKAASGGSESSSSSSESKPTTPAPSKSESKPASKKKK
jgi:putative FmdB family regulatory protein